MIVSTNGHRPAVGKTEYDLMKAAVDPCVAAIAACDLAPESCVVATDVCNLGLMIPYTLTGMNPCEYTLSTCPLPSTTSVAAI